MKELSEHYAHPLPDIAIATDRVQGFERFVAGTALAVIGGLGLAAAAPEIGAGVVIYEATGYALALATGMVKASIGAMQTIAPSKSSNEIDIADKLLDPKATAFVANALLLGIPFEQALKAYEFLETVETIKSLGSEEELKQLEGLEKLVEQAMSEQNSTSDNACHADETQSDVQGSTSQASTNDDSDPADLDTDPDY